MTFAAAHPGILPPQIFKNPIILKKIN